MEGWPGCQRASDWLLVDFELVASREPGPLSDLGAGAAQGAGGAREGAGKNSQAAPGTSHGDNREMGAIRRRGSVSGSGGSGTAPSQWLELRCQPL
jgi:hypothetical protein